MKPRRRSSLTRARRRRSPARRSSTASTSPERRADLTIEVELFGPVPTRPRSAAAASRLDGHRQDERRRYYTTAAGHAARGRLLHLPRVGGRVGRRTPPSRPLRRDVRDDARLGPADRDDGRLGRGRAPRLGCSPTASSSPGSARPRQRSRFGSYGPFASRAAIRCTGKPYWQGRVTAQGDGELRSPPSGSPRRASTPSTRRWSPGPTSPVRRRLRRRRRDVPRRAGHRHRPRRRDAHGRGRRARAGRARSRDDRLARIDAQSLLPGSTSSRAFSPCRPTSTRPGGGSTGRPPASRSGAILIAGHVDSARRGAGAFFPLKQAGEERRDRRAHHRRRRDGAVPLFNRTDDAEAAAADLDLVAEGPNPSSA